MVIVCLGLVNLGLIKTLISVCVHVFVWFNINNSCTVVSLEL